MHSRRWFSGLLALCLLPTLGSIAADRAAELDALKAKIASIRQGIEADTERRDVLAGKLRESDLAVQAGREQLAATRQRRLAIERQLAELQREKTAVEQSVAAEQDMLAAELRLAYMAGRQEALVVLLNQQNPADLGRMLTYSGYLARARTARIDAIAERLAHLQLLTDSAAKSRDELRQVEASQATAAKQLDQARATRRTALAAAQSKLKTRADQVAKLEREAAALNRLIAELARSREEFARQFPDDFKGLSKGFARNQGRLPWPTAGKLVARFGQPRAGSSVKWEGILIAASPGSPVRALHTGRVIYADYLYGMGLMAMVEHGDGYVSIYGHNEQLFCKVGDMVDAGEVLGVLAEPTGSGQKPELHFEIRKGKQALDPERWLRKP